MSGSRKRRSSNHSTTAADQRHVWLLLPESASEQQQSLRAEVERAVLDHGLEPIRARRTRAVRFVGGPEHDRPYQVLSSRDSGDLYADCHRSQVLAISMTAVRVLRDPSRDPPPSRQAMSLSDLLRSKALTFLLRAHGDAKPLIERFASDGIQKLSCDGEHDPRVLPLHVFTNEVVDLDSVASRQDFQNRYGPPANRRDSAARLWQQARGGAMHGRDSLRVAGHVLPAGFQWDVKRGEHGGARLITTSEVWHLQNKSAYANVYPDAYVRPGQRNASGRCRRVWP